MNSPRSLNEAFSDVAIVRWLHVHRRGCFALLYIWFAAYSTLLPFDFHWANGHRNLASLADTFRLHATEDNPTDFVLNILLYIPLGAAVALAVQHRIRRWYVSMPAGFLAGALLAVAVEFIQLFSSSRVGSTTDMLTNSGGALIGCFAAPAIGIILRHLRRRRREVMATQPLWHLATWAAAALVLCGLVPFDVREDLGQIWEGLRSAHFRPFWQFAARASELPEAGWTPAAFWVDFAGDAGAFLLFGAMLALAATAEARLTWPAAVFIALWCGIGLAVLIETSQILIASRGFDTTDIVAAAAGTVVGAMAGAWIGRTAARRRWTWGGPQRLIGAPLLAAACLGQVGYLVAQGLEPFEFRPFPRGDVLWSAIGLVPFGAYTAHLTPALVAEFVLKLVRYALLGVVLMILLARLSSGGRGAFRRHLAAVIAAAMGISAAIEVAQLSIPGRYGDVTDVAIAAMGAFAAGVGVQWYVDAVDYARRRLRRAASRQSAAATAMTVTRA